MQVSSHTTRLRTSQGFSLKVAARPISIAGNKYENTKDRKRYNIRNSYT